METLNRKKSIVLCLLLVGLAVPSVSANECDNWQTLHPEWIFCDDFEDGTPLVREGRYFEHENDEGEFIVADGVGVDFSKGMRALFQAGEVGAGNLLLGFGRNPNSYMNNGIRETEDFREIYYRMYLRMQAGWVGSPAKLSRATSFSSSTSWAQAMIAHLWSSGDYLLVDPASGVENGIVVTTKYNDFVNLHWLGYQAGVTPIFDSQHDGIWYCIEHHIKLNDPGQSNGVQEFWIDGNLEARRDSLNFVDTWTDYAINAVFFENYWNSGSPQLQRRFFDNIVVSTQLIGPVVSIPKIIYVDADPTGANNGTTWLDAFNHLRDALSAAGSGDEILVAQGIYKPDEDTAHPNGSGSRNATFQLRNGVAIKGGYAGFGEPDPDARDIELYETILSGDLAGNDIQVDPCDLEDEPTRAENSYHVVTGSYTDKTAVLNGFTITAGNANGSFSGARGGGGMFNQSGSPTVTDCTFRGNYGSAGGGMNTRGSSPTVTNCTFRDNRATSGGGMSSSGYQTVRGCKFIGNSATSGGGINVFVGEPLFEKCIIRGNSASEDGGGIQFFTDNWAKVIGCEINGNTAGRNGGGMYCSGCYEEDMIINCSISGNTAGNLGGGMYTTSDSSMNLFNCIFWGDTPDEIYVEPTNWPPTVYYCCIQGAWPGLGNIDIDPQFVDPCNGDYHLLPSSPCIDAGDNTAVPAGVTTDLDGNPRFVDQPEVPDTGNGTAPIVDMGAHEANYIEVPMKFTPQALNLSSGGKLVKAHFVLPEGFTVEDVDANTPAVIAQFGVESYNIKVLLNDEGLVKVEAAFRRSDLCNSITGYDDNIEVMVIGRLTTGRQFYGTDIIKITDRAFDHLAVFVSYWLEADCIEPDWCGGADLNQDSVVNFLDFALLDRCCIEVAEE